MTPTRLGTFDYDLAGGFVQGPAGDKNRATGQTLPPGEAFTPIFAWYSHSVKLTGPVYEFVREQNVWVRAGTETIISGEAGYEGETGLRNWEADIEFLRISVQSHEAADYAARGRRKPNYRILFIQPLFSQLVQFLGTSERAILLSVSSSSQLTPASIPFPTSLVGMGISYTTARPPTEPHGFAFPGNNILFTQPSDDSPFSSLVDSFLDAFFGAWQAGGGTLESHWLSEGQPSAPLAPFFMPQIYGSNAPRTGAGVYAGLYDLMVGYLLAGGQDPRHVERWRELLIERTGHDQLRFEDGQRIGDLFMPPIRTSTQGRWVRHVGTFIRSFLP